MQFNKKKKRQYKCLSIEKRKLLNEYLEQGFSKQDIAKLIGVSTATIYREIQRGFFNGKYSPYLSQKKYEKKLKQRGPESLLSNDKELASIIANLILNENLSPERILKILQELGYSKPSSVRTIYTAIDNGLIPNVTRKNLRTDTTSLFSKGLIRIPKWIRDELNIQDGDRVQIKLDNDKIIIEH